MVRSHKRFKGGTAYLIRRYFQKIRANRRGNPAHADCGFGLANEQNDGTPDDQRIRLFVLSSEPEPRPTVFILNWTIRTILLLQTEWEAVILPPL